MPGLHEIQIGIIQIGTISIEAPNRNPQLHIYIKSLSNGYQSQLIIKISIQDFNISEILYIYIYIYLLLVFFVFQNCLSFIHQPNVYIYTNE